MKKAIQLESGNIVLVEGDHVSVKVEHKNGKEDRPRKIFKVGKVSRRDWEKMMEKPNDFNMNRFATKELKK